jgi:hypothetical protein
MTSYQTSPKVVFVCLSLNFLFSCHHINFPLPALKSNINKEAIQKREKRHRMMEERLTERKKNGGAW